MATKYRIRLQAIVPADNDGTGASTVTAAMIAAELPAVNLIFAPAEVEFVFDPTKDFLKINNTIINREFTPLESPNVGTDKWDHEPLVDAETHMNARTELAKQFPHKLVVIYRRRKRIEKEESGNWSIVNSNTSSSSSNAWYVNMSNYTSATSLAHEIGHYLQLPHPFVGGVENVSDAAKKIKEYVEAGNDKVDGLVVLDGDRNVLTDTPADCASGIFESEGLDKCGTVGQIEIPVKFGNETKVYTLKPNRDLVMSYFKGCDELGTKTLSAQQSRRVRDGLELRNRHSLISLKSSFAYEIIADGSASGGNISEIEVATVRAGRVATVVRTGTGDLKVIVWDVDEPGAVITRRGDISGGTVGKVSICGIGQNQVVTAVSTGNQMKVILFKINQAGVPSRLGENTVEGKIKDVACCTFRTGLGSDFIATAIQREDDTLRVDVWQSKFGGEIKHHASATAGKINTSLVGFSTPRLTITPVGAQSFVTLVRLEEGTLRSILWKFGDDKKLLRLESSTFTEPKVGLISGCQMAREVNVAAISDTGKNLKLVAYSFPEDGNYIAPKGQISAGDISQLDMCRIGTEMVVTAVRLKDAKLKLILWHITATGDHIIRLTDHAVDQDLTQLSVCQSDRDQCVAAFRDGQGKIKLMAWKFRVMPSVGTIPDLQQHFDFVFRNLNSKPSPPVNEREWNCYVDE